MFRLPSLPFEYDKFEPLISAKTLHDHHDGHHREYVDHLNELIKGTFLEKATLQELIDYTGMAQSDDRKRKIFQNACQHWLHSSYWKFMANPPALDETTTTQIVELCLDVFGAGWVALRQESEDKRVVNFIHDTGTLPSDTILLVDLWEHAYYLDYQFHKEQAVRSFLEAITNER